MSSTTASQTIPRAATPTPVAERSLAPDLARGMMLLLIVLAHVPWFLYRADVGAAPMHPSDGGALDRIAQAFTIVVVDARTHTMFGFLFAYGIGQMVARQLSRGATFRDARRVLRRRHWLLLTFGLVHAVLLWQGDILGTYGLIGLVMVPLFLQRSDRTLKVWIGILLGLAALSALASLAAGLLSPVELSNPVQDAQRALPGASSYLATLVDRVPMWGFGLVSGLASLALPAAFLMGLLAARHRVLDEPSQHLPLLRVIAIGGIALGWSAGVVQALVHIGVIDVAATTFGGLHFLTGIAAGAGYAAAFGLVAHALARRAARHGRSGAEAAPLPVRMIVALGRRSMSGYLAQSVLLVPLLSAWGLGLGAHLTSATALLYGLGVWGLTVVVAFALDRAGRRGPAEVLLRRFTYGRR